jgi:outer membrane protein assembly factor BamD (BamD/ComL family)
MRALRSAGLLALLFMSLGLALTGCKSRDGRDGPMTDPQVVYQRAHKAILQGDYPLAIRIYEALMARSRPSMPPTPSSAKTRPIRASIMRGTSRASPISSGCRISSSAGSTSI